MFALALLLAAPPAPARPLFDGTSLAGWVNVNCAPDTFAAKNGEIVTTGSPTGFLRTDRQYENFVLEFEWMHTRPAGTANSGLFVWGDPLPAVGTGYTRGIEVQVLNNFEADWATSHGDLFSIWGAKCTPDRPHPRKGTERCLPSERRVKGPGHWNHYRVTANDGVLKLAVNGKEVSGVSNCSPRKGYLALESEGAECHFRNLRITELPSTSPKPEECADEWKGHKSLFDGLTFDGWKVTPGFVLPRGRWEVTDGVLRCIGGGAQIELARPVRAAELVFDLRPTGNNLAGVLVQPFPGFTLGFNQGRVETTSLGTTAWADNGRHAGTPPQKAAGWHRARLALAGNDLTVTVDGRTDFTATASGPLAAHPVKLIAGGPTDLRNLFLRELPEGNQP